MLCGRLFAALYDRGARHTEEAGLAERRHNLLAGLEGDVLEVGAGTGLNLVHYSPSVRLALLEPDPHMRRKLSERIGALAHTVEIVDGVAEELPFPEASFDAVVGTLVLCSVADPDRALAEIWRVLRPGGRLLLIEHVRGEGMTARLQDVIAPLSRAVLLLLAEPPHRRRGPRCWLRALQERLLPRGGCALDEAGDPGCRYQASYSVLVEWRPCPRNAFPKLSMSTSHASSPPRSSTSRSRSTTRTETLLNLSAHFYRQAVEERNHAMMMVEYLLDADLPVTIPGIGAPQTEFADAVAPVTLALEQERTVTRQISELAALARKEGDLVGAHFLDWFLKEQLEEESSMSDLHRIVERAATTNLLLAEQQLATMAVGDQGVDPSAPPAAGGAL